mmetsp:Transcript_33281/g.75852  ORF Transcript_33281/g.75852 Transcript_33281/m.75852 type:complete len:848 (+) Transcript_33281:75-2618(+)
MAQSAAGSFRIPELVQRQCVTEDTKSLLQDIDSNDLASHYSALSEDEAASPALREAFLLLAVAEDHWLDDEVDESAKSAKDAAGRFQQENQRAHELEALRVFFRTYHVKGLSSTAAEKAGVELNKCKEAGDKAGEAVMLMSLGECDVAAYKPTNAVAKFKDAAAIFKSVANTKMEAKALIEVVGAELAAYLKTEAVETAKAADALAKASGDAKTQAQAALTLAEALVEAEVFGEEPLAAARRSTDFAREAKQPRLEAAAIGFTAALLMQAEQPKRALRVVLDALELAQEAGHKRGEAAAVSQATFTLMDLGDYNRAYEMATQALSSFQATGYKRGEAAVRQALAYIYSERHEPELALRESELEVTLFEELGDKTSKAKALVMQAGLHYYNRDGSACKNVAQEASDIFQELKDVKWEGIARYVEVFGYLQEDDLQEATNCAEEVLAVFRQVEDKRLQAYALWAASSVLLESGEFDEAVDRNARAQGLFREIRDSRSEAITLVLASDTRRLIGHHADAAALAENGAVLCSKSNFMRGKAACLQRQALALLEGGEPEAASKLLEEARVLFQRTQDKQGEVSILSFISLVNLEMTINTSTALSGVADQNSAVGKKYKKELAKSSREAKSKALSGVAIAKWMGDKSQEGLAQLYLAHSESAYARFSEGFEAAKLAAELFAEVGDRPSEVHARVAACEILDMTRQNRDIVAIEKAANQALELASSLGDKESEARAQRVLDNCKTKVEEKEEVKVATAVALPSAQSAAVVEAKSSLDPDFVKAIVAQATADTLTDVDGVSEDSPLMDSGMDSLSAVSFRNTLASKLSVSLPAAMMFDYPSQRSIVEHILELTAA